MGNMPKIRKYRTDTYRFLNPAEVPGRYLAGYNIVKESQECLKNLQWDKITR